MFELPKIFVPASLIRIKKPPENFCLGSKGTSRPSLLSQAARSLALKVGPNPSLAVLDAGQLT